MIFTEQALKGVVLISPEPHEDERGMLRRNFCEREFKAQGLMVDIKQSNISENLKAFTLRGFHYQFVPRQEDKVISCIRGSIYDIIVDMRPQSPTYLKWQAYELKDENRSSIYVPMGCANAYMTMKDNTWVSYFHSEFYSPGDEGGIRYDDEFFHFDWPAEPKVISERDLAHPPFRIDH